MTYNEWRDELKLNLLSVSISERKRVLDYYAEAYADRRDAGFTEREIIEDFGAPYDAAQRILSENRQDGYSYGDYDDEPRSRRETRRDERARRAEDERLQREEQSRRLEEERARRDEERLRSIEAEKRRRENAKRGAGGFESYNYADDNRNSSRTYNEAYRDNNYGKSNYNYNGSAPAPAPAKPAKNRGDYTWVFVLLCIIFCVPICGLIVAMIGVTVGVCVAPFATLVSGVITVGSGIGTMVAHGLRAGICEVGIGIIIFGVSIALIPLFVKLIKLMWKLFGMFFKWLKSLFSGKENA